MDPYPEQPQGVQDQPPAVAWAELEVMGSAARLCAVSNTHGGAALRALLDGGVTQLQDLEQRWSRFLPTSELCWLNDRAGSGWSRVSEPTFTLLEHMVQGWRATSGAFDPTITTALEAAGYDRSLELLTAAAGLATALPAAAPPVSARPAPTPTPGLAGVRLDAARAMVLLPAGVRLDAGGIGKGLAADLVVAGLGQRGCDGAMASVGGDVRVCGQPPTGDAWRVEIAAAGTAPHRTEAGFGPTATVASRTVRDGAVATSSVLRRRWQNADGQEAHHVIDPRTGSCSAADLLQVSVSANQGWWAEVLSTAALAAGAEQAAIMLSAAGVDAVLIDGQGRHRIIGNAFELIGAPSAAARSAR
ncbi:MAG: FAD:protein FMN transferase [Acidimicrobiales bacterium]